MLEKYADFQKFKSGKYVKELMEEKGVKRPEAMKILRKKVPDEAYFQKKIIEALKKRYPDAYIVKLTLSMYSEAGVPDILCVVDGHYYGFEVKKPLFGKATKLQEVAMRRIREAGGDAAVVSYPEQCFEIIEYRRG